MCYESMHALTSQIINSIKPDGTGDPTVQGNWPTDAIMAVRFSTVDKQFPSVDYPKETVYFSTLEESEQWFDEKREWVKGTDFDFSISCELYSWDLGPQFVGTLTY